MVFQGVRGWGEQFPSQCFEKEKTQKNNKLLLWGAFICRFSLPMEILKPNPCEK
jgi:hypothetical protein